MQNSKGYWFAAVLLLVLAGCGDRPPELPQGTAVLQGAVVDATSGRPVSGAIACFVYNGTVTDVCDSTDNNGIFQLSRLPAGGHEVQVSKPGFTTARAGVQLASGSTTTVRLTLNPLLAAGEMRIVLVWGEQPSDLDSHLWVPQAGGYYEVYFVNKGDCRTEPWACLDVDDTTSFGPETITIAQAQGGTYSYAVHWFAGTGSWSGSNAEVRVYDASGLIATYTAPADTGDPTTTNLRWWYVFDLQGGTLIPKGALSENPPVAR